MELSPFMTEPLSVSCHPYQLLPSNIHFVTNCSQHLPCQAAVLLLLIPPVGHIQSLKNIFSSNSIQICMIAEFVFQKYLLTYLSLPGE